MWSWGWGTPMGNGMCTLQFTQTPSFGTATTATARKYSRRVHVTPMQSRGRRHNQGEDLNEVQACILRHRNPRRGIITTAMVIEKFDMDADQPHVVTKIIPWKRWGTFHGAAKDTEKSVAARCQLWLKKPLRGGTSWRCRFSNLGRVKIMQSLYIGERGLYV